MPVVRNRNRILLPLFLILGSPVWAQADEPPSRSELWRQRRLEKLQALPDRVQPAGIEKALLWLEDRGLITIFQFRVGDFYPTFRSITNGSGLSLGARYWKPRLAGHPFSLQSSAAVSIRGYQHYDLQFGKFGAGGSQIFESPLMVRDLTVSPLEEGTSEETRAFFFYGDFRYRHFPQLAFFGLGPDSILEQRTDFLQRDASYDVVAGLRWTPRMGAALRAGLIQVDVEPGTSKQFPNTQDVFEDANAPGLDRQPDFLHYGTGLWLDYRDHVTNPHLGGILQLTVTRFDDRDLDRFDFHRFEADSRHYVPLGSRQRVLALRFFTSLDGHSDGKRVPFYLQQTLGGSDRLRGFNDFRFRDTHLLYLSGEYRWEPAEAMELALFYDTGKVFPDLSGFNLADLRHSWGFGVRFKSPDKVFLRFDIARSVEGTRLHFKFGPAF